MRFDIALGFAVAFAAGSAGLENVYEKSTTPEKQPLPEIAGEITIVEEDTDYLVKFACEECPFGGREHGGIVQVPAELQQESSLLLNFRIDDVARSLQLNGLSLMPLAPHPPSIAAFQVPANISEGGMKTMSSLQMPDETTSSIIRPYGYSLLHYEHTLLGTEQPGENWVQFDIKGFFIPSMDNPSGYMMPLKPQKIIELLISHQISNDKQTLVIKQIGVLDRNDIQQPIKMSCGKDAMIRTEFNPMQWDYYGKIGTTTRTIHRIMWGTVAFFKGPGLLLILVSVVFGIVNLVRWRVRRNKEQVAAQVKEDAEAALLAPECDDSPPDYFDVLPLETLKVDE